MPDPVTQLLHPEVADRGDGDAAHAINQRIFETSLDLILVVDRKGNILRASPSSLAILGYRPEELVGRSASEFLLAHDLERARTEMRLARRTGVLRNFECRYLHKQGELVPLVWAGVWSEPEQQHFFIGRDMTERIKLEGQLRQAQRMEALGQLTGGVAHDFNNLLTVISGAIETLHQAVAGDPDLAAAAASIDQAAERGAKLTQRMLAFARKQQLEARRFDLNQTVAGMAEMLRRTLGERTQLVTLAAADLWPALADPSQVEDAILNLAVNARDAMPKGGRLTIETRNVHLDEHYAAEHPDIAPGDYVAVIVSDTGSGMAPEVIERAFEPFFTTKEVGRGTGLGLSMVYGFAKQSRGHVKIYSELGHGTAVKLYLPRAPEALATVTDAPGLVPELRARDGETVLVVEDDAAVRKIAVQMLQQLGYRVLQAADGKSALEILSAQSEIDLLFTDLMMSGGIDGRELLRLARAERPGLKALFASGYSDHFVADGPEIAPGALLLNKPYRRQKLAGMVRAVLDGN